MDRMLLTILALWFVAIAVLRIGDSEASKTGKEFSHRDPAWFTHDAHMEREECTACHHRYENGENVVEDDELDGGDAMRCATCHNSKASIGRIQAFHRQCIRCHRAGKKKNEATGPVTCGTCHPCREPDESVLIIAR